MGEPPARILVVDDEAKNVKLLEALLLPRGYQISTASNGEEALQQVQRERPDLILLDVMMPVMDGFEVCKRLKEDADTRLIPVVIMTALDQVEDRIQGVEAGADDFLSKPVHRDELLARIRTSLRLKRTIDNKLSLLQQSRDSLVVAPLCLTILRQGEALAMDLTESDPIVSRGQLPIEESLLTEIGEELARITTLANTSTVLGTVGAAALSEGLDTALQRLGGLIFSLLFPASARQKLTNATPGDLFLRVDEQLLHVPWELAFDGQDFLLTKFRIGRQVLTQQPPTAHGTRRPETPERLKMLLIVDPTETLPAATEEAEHLCSLLDACSNLEATVLGGKRLRKLELLQALSECDLVHYAGHARFDAAQPGRSGWVLHDAVLTASELSRVAHPPLLVFANACQAGTTTPWQARAIYEGQAFGIGSAFLLAGTQNYIGTFCVIHDTSSTDFAADFYRQLLQGQQLGEALAVARRNARQMADRSGLLWASYLHYGNPTFRLPIVAAPAAAPSNPG
jgi:DNA-binding response OmpR family regulator